MTFDKINRRAHLYLGLFLLGWLFMYGITSVAFSHPQIFEDWYDDGKPLWNVLLDREYAIETVGVELDSVGRRILEDSGIRWDDPVTVHETSDGRIVVSLGKFFTLTRMTYTPEERRLVVDKRRFRWDRVMSGMHARAGFGEKGVLEDAWAVLVDVVMAAVVLWIVSGTVMWWRLSQTRRWGALALAAGFATFLLFSLTL